MIKVNGLTKIFQTGHKQVIAVNDLTFDISEGEFITVTGKSGSGKSTLLYQLGLLDHPTSGSICVEDTDVASLDRDERTLYRLNNLGYVFQDYALVPTLNATENVSVTLLMQGKSQKEADEIAIRSLEKVGLAERKRNLPSQLSGGEQQRVSIARAIANKPKIIYADEPTANLDSETARKVLDVLLNLHKQGQTIVMVTHEPEYAKLGNRTLVLSDGKMVDFS